MIYYYLRSKCEIESIRELIRDEKIRVRETGEVEFNQNLIEFNDKKNLKEHPEFINGKLPHKLYIMSPIYTDKYMLCLGMMDNAYTSVELTMVGDETFVNPWDCYSYMLGKLGIPDVPYGIMAVNELLLKGLAQLNLNLHTTTVGREITSRVFNHLNFSLIRDRSYARKPSE